MSQGGLSPSLTCAVFFKFEIVWCINYADNLEFLGGKTVANLLTKQPMNEAQLEAELYAVFDKKDYRVSLATVLALVTKASIGLDKVNNTSDAEKPVSGPVAEALAAKANIVDTVSKEAFASLAQSLSNYITIDALNESITQVNQLINSKLSSEEVSQAIADAVVPVNNAVSLVANEVTGLLSRVQSLENADLNIISREDLEEAIGLVSQSIAGAVSVNETQNARLGVIEQDYATKSEVASSFNGLSNSLSGQISQLSQELSSMSTTISGINSVLGNKADLEHNHHANDIAGLRDVIASVISESDLDCKLNIVRVDW